MLSEGYTYPPGLACAKSNIFLWALQELGGFSPRAGRHAWGEEGERLQ